jgi:hypothetical protein
VLVICATLARCMNELYMVFSDPRTRAFDLHSGGAIRSTSIKWRCSSSRCSSSEQHISPSHCIEEMAIPLTYPHHTKNSFSYPRSPPTIPRYDPPQFEKDDRSPSIGGNNYFPVIGDSIRNHAIAMLTEFVGTMMFLFFGLAAGQISNDKPDTTNRTGFQSAPSLLQLLYISS